MYEMQQKERLVSIKQSLLNSGGLSDENNVMLISVKQWKISGR
jgi:hypothetical protein